MKNRLMIFALFLLLQSCVSGGNVFEASYVAASKSDKTIPYPNSIKPLTINVIDSDDISKDLYQLSKDGYVVLGMSNFKDTIRSDKKAREFASKINATDILYFREFLEKRYVNIKAATTRDPVYNTTGAKRPAGHSEFRKFEQENIYQYKVVYLIRTNGDGSTSDLSPKSS